MTTCSSNDINLVTFTEAVDGLADGFNLEQAERITQRTALNVTDIKNALYNQRGIFYIILSSLCYALLGVCVQLTTSIHEMEEGFIRGSFLLFFSVVGIIIGNTKFVFSKGQLFWITVNGCLNTFAQIGMFAAYNLTAVGDATAVMYSMPPFSGVIAWIFLKEPLTLLDVIFTTLCITGVFLVSKPDFIFGNHEEEGSDSNFIGTMWAFSALISLSCACVLTRKLRYVPSHSSDDSSAESCDSLILTFAQSIIVIITFAILNSYIGEWSVTKDVAQLGYISGIGIFGFFGIYLYALSLKTQKALVISVLFTSSIFMAYLFQFVIFRVYPDIISGLGTVLILSSVFGVLLSDRKKSKTVRNYATVEQSTEF